MDLEDQQTGVMDGSCCEGRRKRGRPGNYGLGASIEPMPLAVAPPEEFFNRYPAMSSSNIFVYPAGYRMPPSTGFVSTDGLQPRNSVGSENLASGAEHMLEPEIEENTGTQAKRQMREFSSSIIELCTAFDTSKKKNEELRKQVINLEGQIEGWKDKEANWDEQKKEIKRERDEAREEARKAVNEKRSLEQKLEKATKQAEDAKASAKKAIDKAVASTTQYKTGLGNFVAYLANGEGKSLGNYVNELVKETPPADGGAGHEANVMGPEKDEAP